MNRGRGIQGASLGSHGCHAFGHWSPVTMTTAQAELSLGRSLELPEVELEFSSCWPVASLPPAF